jgi:DNA-binding LytR/AlgR family response regulator
MKINCIAIDDEPLALNKMKRYIERIDFLNLRASFNNGIEAISYLKDNKVDLIFLDIQMEDLTGIELLEALQKKPGVIITTAYESYALKGYELDVTDYLLKPISFQRFVKAVDKVYESLYGKDDNETIAHVKTDSPVIDDYIFVKTEYRIQKINLKDILYIEGMKDYIRIVTLSDKVMTLQSLKKMVDLLPEKQFIRVHKSYIIAIDKIESIERNRIIIGGERIPIGESFRQYFFRMLGGKNII